MIPENLVHQIHETAAIEDVIGDFVYLKKSGSNYKGLSPFTDEKTPSFMVSPAKQIFKCFSSGKGGNAASFLMEHEHFTYPEALRYLAKKYNIEIPEEHEATAEELQQKNERESLLLINEFACQFFSEQMTEKEEGRAIGESYFKERGFEKDTIEKFQLGYSPDQSSAFTDAALAKGYQKKYLLQTGLTKEKDDRTFDFFRGRVMFPIRNVSGKVLGFGGRTLRNDKKTAKYFNSPESPVYDKSKVLYGIYFAKSAMIKYDNCYLVEGYTDVISLWQNGVENVVASSGTALTEQQIQLISRYTKNVTILFDGDDAGIRASFRGIDMLLKAGLKIKIVLFPEGEDPDSYAKNSSQSELESYLVENAQDFIVFKSNVFLEEADQDPIKKANLINDVIQSIAQVPEQIERSVYVKECANRFDFDEQTVMNGVNKKRRQQKNKQSGKINAPGTPIEEKPNAQKQKLKEEVSAESKLDYHECDIIRILLLYGTLQIDIEAENEEKVQISVIEYVLSVLEKDEIILQNKMYDNIIKTYEQGFLQDTLCSQKHFINHSDPEISSLAADLITSEYSLSDKWSSKHHIYTETEEDRLENTVQNAMNALQLATVKHRIGDVQKKLKSNDMGDGEVIALMEKQKKLDQAKTKLSERLGRIVVD